MVQVEPRLCDPSRRKNNAFTLSATLLTSGENERLLLNQ